MELEPIAKLTRDLKQAATTLSRAEARYLVDSYYLLQEDRKRSENQVRALDESGEPHEVIVWLATNSWLLERNVRSALGAYASADPVGRWSQSIVGIGPVISAGLLAHIDLAPNGNRLKTVGHIWRFAGLDPSVTWEKGQKRPWNASLKTLCWKIGESFVKVCNHKDDFYGHLYAARKDDEIRRNDWGEFEAQAKAKLDRFNIRKETDAWKYYSLGKLPPAHIHARAKRWAVKLFLSHWFEVSYRERWGEAPPKPYALTEACGHAHAISAPHYP